jgi:PAS domain S-box-containing protein
MNHEEQHGPAFRPHSPCAAAQDNERTRAQEAVGTTPAAWPGLQDAEFWQRSLDALPDPIAIVDTQRRIVWVNQRMADRLGVAKDQCVGQMCCSCLHGADEPPPICPHSQLLHDGKERTAEVRGERLGGNFHVTVSPLRDPAGRLAGSVHIARDVAERRLAEKALRESESRYRSLVETAQEGLGIVDREENVVFVNQAFADMLGYKPVELVGLNLRGLAGDGEFAKYREETRRRLDGRSSCYETVLRHKSGELRYFSLSASPLVDDSGAFVGTMGLLMDIGDRKRAEEALRKESAFRRTVIERAAEGVCVCHAIEQFPYVEFTVWNDRMTEITGYTMKEINERGWYQTVYPDPEVRQNAVQRMERMRHGDDLLAEEWEITMADGERRTVLISTSVLTAEEGVPHVLALMSDITERKRADRITAARLRLLERCDAQSVEEFLVATLDEAEALTGSQIGFYHFLGADERTVSLQAWSARTRRDSCTAEGKGRHYDVSEAGVWVDCVRARGPVVHNDYAALPHRKGLPPGHAPVVRELVVPVLRHGRIVAILGVGNKGNAYDDADVQTISRLADLAWDIVEHKRAAEALHVSEEKFRAIASHTPDHVLIQDRDLRYTLVLNPQLGLTEAEMLGKTDCDILEAADAEKLTAIKRTVLETGKPFRLETSLINCQGGTEYFDGNYVPKFNSSGQVDGVIGYFRNVTDRKRAEERLIASEAGLQEAQEIASVGSYVLDVPQGLWTSSNVLDRIFGISRDYLRTVEGWGDLVHLDDRQAMLDYLRNEVLGERKSFDRQYRIVRHGDQQVRWVHGLGRLEFDADGVPIRMVGTIQDITERKQAEDALRESERLLSTTQQIAHVGSWTMDMDSMQAQWSEESYRLFGVTPDRFALTPEGFLGLLHPDDRPAMEKWIRGCISGQHPPELEFRIVRPDGTIRFLCGRGDVYSSGDGTALRLVGSVQDITERKQAEEVRFEALARFSGFAGASQYGMGMADLDGRIVYVNNTLARMLGEPSADDCLGKHFPTAYYGEPITRKLQEEVMPTLMRDGHWHGELELRTPDGRCVPTDENYFVIRNEHGQPRYLADILTDITDRKQEQALLRQAKKVAEAANRAKSEFLANMSHEIRTPMTAVMGFADVLMMSPDMPPGEQHTFLEGIQRNGKALLRLIDDILDLSRIEADQLPMDKADCAVQQVIDDVLSAVQIQAQQKGLRLNVDYQFPLPATVHTDRARLRQVLVNLAGNAVKFTEHGEVRLTVRCLRGADGAGRLQFAVSDTGIGIAPDQIPHLFQPFMQVDASSTRRYGGTGLGLGISKRLAKALGGDIEVVSRLGLGSTFTLTIDAGSLKGPYMVQSPTAEGVRKETALAAHTAGLRGRVLFAEDFSDARDLVGHYLTAMNVEADMAEDGRKACEMAERSRAAGRPYDVILMDIQMPVMDGFEATGWLRQHGWTGPIVALTAYAMVGDRERCLAAGCDDYLAKPLTPEGLRETLSRHLRQRDETAADQPAGAAPVVQSESRPTTEEAGRTAWDQLKEQFVRGLPERARVLEEALRAGDRKAVAFAAHPLKGTAGAYGLSGIAHAARAVEALASGQSEMPELQIAVAELLRLCCEAATMGAGKHWGTAAQQ